MGNNAKKSLYDHVDHLRSRLGLSLYDHPVNTLDLCLHTIAGIEVIHHSFDSAGFCGAAFRSVYMELHADHETGAADNK